MTVKEIIKKTLQKMNKEGVLITPLAYKEYFCKEARSSGLLVDDCLELERYSSKMSETLQKQFKKYYAKNLDDLIVFLISNLNRAQLGDAEYLNNALYSFLNTTLDTITLLGSKSAKELSLDTKTKLKTFYDQKSVEFFRDRFVEFNKGFVSPIDERWREYIARFTDISDFSSKAFEIFEKSNSELKLFRNYVVEIARPSLSKELSAKFELDEFLRNKHTPNEIEEAIKEALAKRFELDKKEIEKYISTLNDVIGLISLKLMSFIDRDRVTIKSIDEIKNLLSKAMEVGEIEGVKQKVVAIADKLESELEMLNSSLDEKNREINELREKIKKLEESLREAEVTSKTDYLTKVMNKRGLKEELQRFESIYKRRGISYALLFLDIDQFKNINDTYGHDAGDKVLSSIGTILLKRSRKEDVIGRFGGEEFIVILYGSGLEGAKIYAEHIRAQIETSKFIYKNKRIPVTVSLGIAIREDFNSMEETLNSADEKMYLAKRNGRNRVEC